MGTLFIIITATISVSLISFIGALTLFFKDKILEKILLILVAFSAGALFGGAFLHLIPEAIETLGIENNSLLKIFLSLILGFCLFFILEQFISWHHHHIKECKDCPKVKPFSYLILISDSFHNFIDGIIIAASFVVSLQAGIVTTLAVALHEIPQEIGDFGVLVFGGFKKSKALFVNFLTALFAVIGGITGFLLFETIGEFVVYLLPFAAGNFIYIAASDLIPEIKHKSGEKKSFLHFCVFLLGIGIMFLFKLFF